MDDRRFDQLTRLAGDPVTRRRAMQGGVSGLLVAAGLRTATAGAQEAIGPDGCRGEGGNCNNAKCCSGLKCKNGTCKYPQGCGTKGDYCERNSDCCNKFTCNTDKAKCIKDSGGCGKKGDYCNNNKDCCSNYRCKTSKNKCVKD